MYADPAEELGPIDFSILSKKEQRTIAKAAVLSFEGKEDEAEATRFAAGYHEQGGGPE